jgi:hypothetical protein
MSRLIDADNLVLFPNNPESGTNDMIDSWIDECGLSNLELYITEDCPVDVEHALKDLCWKVIQGYINVVETEPTAFDVDKVVKQLEKLRDKANLNVLKNMNEPIPYSSASNRAYAYDMAIEVVKAGGIDE